MGPSFEKGLLTWLGLKYNITGRFDFEPRIQTKKILRILRSTPENIQRLYACFLLPLYLLQSFISNKPKEQRPISGDSKL